MPTSPSVDHDLPERLVLSVEGVTKAFRSKARPVVALADVDFRIRAGQVTGLIGPDGAGKTTLMRLAAGLLVADEGRVIVLGLDVAHQSLTVQASVGYMPQRFGLYEDLTVQENLDLYADLQGVPRDERPNRYISLMRMTGLAPFTGRLAGRLSGGMKQKLGLACTLVRPPRLLLLDEPTVGVDPVSRRELWQIVYRFVEDEGTTVLLSTAYLDEAERCREVVLLHEGKLLGQGPPADFSSRLAGRTFRAHSATQTDRALQIALAGRPEVTDAVIQGDAVRVVFAASSDATSDRWRIATPDVELFEVPPRFEDAFIDLLGQRRFHERPTYATPDAAVTGRRADLDDTQAAIEVHNVQRRFGDFYAVKDITFDVRRGEIFGLLGANGAGKTTTFRMLCGLLPASAGTLKVAGIDVRRTAAAARARIGYMSQKFALYGSLSVAQNLAFFSSAYGLRGRNRRTRIGEVLEQFDLGQVAKLNSAALPLGFKQRLALACALMHCPDILFLDEPTSGVDPLARREFWYRINSLAMQGVTIMVTTHFMEEAEYCDRLAIMVAGKVLAQGTPSAIKDRVRSAASPDPTMEDAFIDLIESPAASDVA
jgi:ABC-2 type transport system ATP-binding protein